MKLNISRSGRIENSKISFAGKPSKQTGEEFRPIHSDQDFYQPRRQKELMRHSQVERPKPKPVHSHISPITSIKDQLSRITSVKTQPQTSPQNSEKTLTIDTGHAMRRVEEPLDDIAKISFEKKVEKNPNEFIHPEIEVEVKYNKVNHINVPLEHPFKNTPMSQSSKMDKIEEILREKITEITTQSKVPRLYYLSQLSQALESGDKSHPFYSHFNHNIQSMQYISTLQPLEEDDFIEKKVYLPPKRNPGMKTLVLDLDETLVHCDEDLTLKYDLKIPIKFTGGEVVECGVTIRPFAKEFLKRMSQNYEIVIFTASHACYANIILNLLDPSNEFITYRMFRDSCIETEEGIFIKDLRVFANRGLDELIIVDNAFYSFGFQVDNGIPIVPFFRDKSDTELEELHDFLLTIKGEADVKDAIRMYFRNDLYMRYLEKPDLLGMVFLKNIETLKLL